MVESLALSGVGGACGVALGCLVTAVSATYQGQRTVLPAVAVVGGFGAALVIGMVAGLYPAVRASRLPPTDALRTA